MKRRSRIATKRQPKDDTSKPTGPLNARAVISTSRWGATRRGGALSTSGDSTMSDDLMFDRDAAQDAFLAELPADPPQGAKFTLRVGAGHELGPTYQAGELVTFHVDDTPTLGATWLFDSGDDVVIALVLGWDD